MNLFHSLDGSFRIARAMASARLDRRSPLKMNWMVMSMMRKSSHSEALRMYHSSSLSFSIGVGAGGIGLPLNAAITMLAWTQVSLILLIIIATVVVSEWVSAKIRHAII
jgi:hypothetical protein